MIADVLGEVQQTGRTNSRSVVITGLAPRLRRRSSQGKTGLTPCLYVLLSMPQLSENETEKRVTELVGGEMSHDIFRRDIKG